MIEKITALAIFLPMVANLSGAAGNQAVAVSIRELSLGLISESDVLRVWHKEILVGFVNGIAIGLLLGLITWLTRFDEPELALVIGSAYVTSSVFAVTLGGALPLFVRRFGVDPAMLSSPILTTLTDMASFFFVLSLATYFLIPSTAMV